MTLDTLPVRDCISIVCPLFLFIATDCSLFPVRIGCIKAGPPVQVALLPSAFFTRPATLPHPPRSGLLLARLVLTAALLGPLTTTPAYFADLARLNSSADRYNNPCPDCSNIRPAISPGYVGSPFGALPFIKRPPRLFMCLLALCRLGCSLRPFGLFTRPDPAPPRIGSAAPGHNSARGPFASF